MLSDFLNMFLHLEEHLQNVIAHQRGWTYMILGMTIFLETGVLVLPFLPGDSLLLTVGALAAGKSDLDPLLSFSLLSLAAVLGDSAAYGLGYWFRGHIAAGKRIHIINPEHLEKTHKFFAKHGSQAVLFARFVPIVRTLAPFAAGVASMAYSRFIKFSVVGATLWVGTFVGLGYAFGNVPIVKKLLPLVAVGVVVLTMIAIAREVLKKRRTTVPGVAASTGQPGEAAGTGEPPGPPPAGGSAALARPSPSRNGQLTGHGAVDRHEP